MPTQRFLKLKEEKKQAILEAAVHEFSRVPYSSASINQIIKEADISRGSFYTYFEDKDDLMRYMLRGFRDNCQERILNPEGTGGKSLWHSLSFWRQWWMRTMEAWAIRCTGTCCRI